MFINKLLSPFGLNLTRVANIARKQESRSFHTILRLGINDAQWIDSKYEAYAREGYATNSDVYTAIDLVATAAATPKWIVFDRQDGNEVQPGFGSAAQLLARMLANPNPRTSDKSFVYAAVAHRLLQGNTFIERAGPDRQPETQPVHLHVLRPDRVGIKQGTPARPVAGYWYEANGKREAYAEHEILHLKKFNPLDDWRGHAPIQSAGYPIAISNAASAFYKKLLDRGYPPLVVKTEESLTDDQYTQLQTLLREKSATFGDVIIENGDVTEIGIDAVKAALTDGKILTKRDIAALFRVPPEMMGDTQSKTYANFRDARRSLYTEAGLPEREDLKDGLNSWLSPLFDGAWIEIDRDSIDALQEDRDIVAKRVVILFNAGIIKRNEGRSELGYELDAETTDGYVFELDPKRQVSVNPLDDEKRLPTGRMYRALLAEAGERSLQPISGAAAIEAGLKAFDLDTDEQKSVYWKQFEQRRESWYQTVQDAVAARFKAESPLVAAGFRSGAEAGAGRVIDAQISQWVKLYEDVYLSVGRDFAIRILEGLKAAPIDETKVLTEDIFQRAIRLWLAANGAKRVVGVSDATKAAIRRELVAGTREGESIYQLSKRIENLYSHFSLVRAERIARTEVISASNLGSQTAARSTNLQLEKEWIATFDDRTRDAHEAANGQKRDINDPYIVAGQQLMFPGDGSLGASADNLIQCRCTESYRVKR